MPVSSSISIQEYPLDTPLWNFCFDSPYSVLAQRASSAIRGFQDAVSVDFISYKQLRDLSTDASVALMRRHKLRTGQTVCIIGANSIWYPVALFSALRLGAVISGASLDCFESAVAAAQAVGIPKRDVVLFEGKIEGVTTLMDLVEAGQLWTSMTLVPASGTTGLPKAVRISHANVIAQMVQMKQVTALETGSGAYLAVLPFVHIAGLSLLIFAPIILRQEVVVLSRFEMKIMLDAIIKYCIKELLLYPLVRQLNFGAAPISTAVITTMKKRFPHFRMRNTWGMTEVTGAAATTPAELQDLDMLMSLEGHFQVLLKGPNVAMGYLNNDRADQETFKPDGYAHSGDLGLIDSSGLLIIHDRIKELSQVKGVAFVPFEFESHPFSYPLVADCAVIGIPHPHSGEVPKAFVVLHDQSLETKHTRLLLTAFISGEKSKGKQGAKL